MWIFIEINGVQLLYYGHLRGKPCSPLWRNARDTEVNFINNSTTQQQQQQQQRIVLKLTYRS